MRTGCFTPTAYGLLDSDSDIAIFNGTDEGILLKGYSPSQALAPWPGGSGLIALVAASTGGSYVSLYKNPLANLRNQYNPSNSLVAKQLTSAPDVPLKDTQGKTLVVNPQTMAFSSGGGWLAVESLTGSFVRINLATLQVRAFAPELTMLGSPALFKSQVAVSDNGRYIAIYNQAADFFRVYDLNTCEPGTEYEVCESYDYLPFVRHNVAGFKSLEHLKFVNDGLLSFEVRADPDSGATVYELAPRDSITSIISYLGLGDSYTSGEGAFDYLTGTDTDNNTCHLSIHSYPLLLARDIFDGGHSVACSGAVINDLGSTSPDYKGQGKGSAKLWLLLQNQPVLLSSILSSYKPGYVAQHLFVRKYQPGIVTVSVGGNDVGFGDIIRACVMPHFGSGNTCYSSYEDRIELTRLIDRTLPHWTALYEQLEAESPGTRLYAIGYPQIAAAGGKCALNVHLDRNEIVFSQELIDYLNGTIRQAAAAAGATYVDISQALAGHRLCEAASYDVAMNGLTAGNDSGALGIKVFGRESYHPNALGQFLIEQAILHKTHNLGPYTATPAEGDPGADKQVALERVLAAPKTGRPVNTIVPDDSMATGLVRMGHRLSIYASGLRDGLQPGANYTIRLDGAAGPVLRTIPGDSDGSVAAGIVLPGGTQPGEHTLDIVGMNQARQPVDVTRPVYVSFAGNDTDGNGVTSQPSGTPGISGGQPALQSPDRHSTQERQVLGASAVKPSAFTHPAKPTVPSVSARVAIVPNETDEYQIIDDTAALLLLCSVLFSAAYLKFDASSRMMLSARAACSRLFRRRPCTKLPLFGYNGSMIWVRKGIVFLLSIVLLVSLIFGVFSFSTNTALKSPSKIEGWLNESGFYNNFVTTVTRQAEQSFAANGQSGSASLNNTVIRQAAKAAFTPQLVQQSVNTFIDGNYVWLQGKTDSPKFNIDLTKAEQNFARQLSQDVEKHLASLPVCSASELVQAQNTNIQAVDPLTMTCLPPGITPQSEATQLTDDFTQQLSNSTGILGNPVITASSINVGSQDRPYYQSLSAAPKVYRWSMRLPLIFAVLALICLLGIIFIAPRRRKGLRRIAVVLLEAGVVLIAVKVVVDSTFSQLKQRILSGLNVGQMEQSLAGLLQRFEAHLTKVDFWFGVAFLALAIVLLVIVWLTREKNNKPPKFAGGGPVSSGNSQPRPAPERPQIPGNNRPTPSLKQPPRRPKPPRLIQ